MTGADLLLSLPEIARLTGRDRRRLAEDARIRKIATRLAPSQASGPRGRYVVALSARNAALGLSIAPAAAHAAQRSSQIDLLGAEAFEFTEEVEF
jgi:hypothetical protein